jgi:hypothetical protein
MNETTHRIARRDLLVAAAAVPVAGMFSTGDANAFTLGGADEDAAIRAAFYYAYPLYEFARTEQTLAKSLGGPGALNTVTRRAQLSGPQSRNVTAPNNDTIYASSFLELSAGPVEIIAPSIPGRYFSIAFMDAFTDNFAYIGTRATQGKGGRFWIVGPQWRGQVPAGVRALRSSTNDVWMLARILVEGPDDLPAATALLEQVQVHVPGPARMAQGFATPATSGVRPAA